MNLKYIYFMFCLVKRKGNRAGTGCADAEEGVGAIKNPADGPGFRIYQAAFLQACCKFLLMMSVSNSARLSFFSMSANSCEICF